MAEDSERSVGLWQEFRRRRVLRVAAAYVAVAFAGLQGMDVVLAGLEVPGWSYRLVMGVAVLGFPLAIVLAWAFDVTSRGIVKTPEDATADPSYEPGPPWIWLAVVSVATAGGLALWLLGP